MSFDKHAEKLPIEDREKLRIVFTRICAGEDSAQHAEIARRMVKIFRSGMRDLDVLAALAAHPTKPTRGRPPTSHLESAPTRGRTLEGENGIINTNDM